MGRESDHIHIVALTKALKVPVCVEYMDREGHSCNSFNFNPNDEVDSATVKPDLTLLYRPGHYDILYPLWVLGVHSFSNELVHVNIIRLHWSYQVIAVLYIVNMTFFF